MSKASSAVTGIADWLADDANQILADLTEDIWIVFAEKVTEELKAGATGHALSKHFWCDLFAALAAAIAERMSQLDTVPEHAVTIVLASDRRRGRPEAAVRLEVAMVWTAIGEARDRQAFDVQAVHLLLATRVLAVFICPAPERHRAVTRCCLEPLVADLS